MDAFEWNTDAGKFPMTMDMPQTLAMGVAFTPMPGLLIEGGREDISASATCLTALHSPTAGNRPERKHELRLERPDGLCASACKRRSMSKTTIRAGFNYGKSPIGAEDVDTNIGSLAITEKHLHAGRDA